jgi:4-amino-4-deoxy-L-arabinose transferase-like glycosyltransferase
VKQPRESDFLSRQTVTIERIAHTSKSAFGFPMRSGTILLHQLPIAFVAAITLFLLTYNISFFPYVSMDEGGHLTVPTALVVDGEYAQKTAHGFNYDGPGVATGPTVLLPVALSFKVFGIGLLQARVVSGLYIVGTLILFYLAAHHLFGRRAATLAAMLMLVAPGFLLSSWHEGGRIVVGEVPAMFYFMAGLLLFWRWMESPRIWRSATIGLLWGLSFITKNQFPMIIVPTLGMFAIAGRYYYRLIRIRDIWIPLAVAGAVMITWFMCQILFVGHDNIMANLERIRAASDINYLVLNGSIMLKSLRFLVSLDVFYGWAIPGIAFGLLMSTRRSATAFKIGMVTSLIVVWLGWFVVGSIGYTRYANPPLQLSVLLLAKMFVDFIGSLSTGKSFNVREIASGLPREKALTLVFILVLALVIGSPVEREIRTTLAADSDRSPHGFAVHVEKKVPDGKVVATFEYSLGMLTDLDLHFPPIEVLHDSERFYTGMDRHSILDYDPVDYGATYLAYGPHARSIRVLYYSTFQNNCWVLTSRVHEHELYSLTNEPGHQCKRVVWDYRYRPPERPFIVKRSEW